MAIIPAIIILGILLFCAYKTVTSARVWQRVASLTVCGLITIFLIWICIPLIRYDCAVKYRSTVIIPTLELWKITEANLGNGNIDQAKEDISYIKEQLRKVGTDNSKYTGRDLLKEIQERQKGEQPGPPYAPQAARR